MSEEKYKEAIIAQAQKDAAEGKMVGSGYMGLKKSFVSVASPDRNSIIFNASKGLVDLFAKGMLKHTQFKDSFGNVVASYNHPNDWRMITTPAERRRESVFDSIYNEAFSAAYKAKTNPSAITGAVSSGNSSINVLV